jgi:hypothetical protein
VRLNSLGTSLYGNTTIYKDGVAVPSLSTANAGSWVWMDDDLIGGQADFGGGFKLYKVVVSTDTLTNIDAVGANIVAGGGSILLAFIAIGTYKGVRTTVPGFGPLPLAGLGDTSLEGLSAVIQNSQAGTGIITYSAAGSTLSSTSIALANGSEIRAKSGLYAYRDSAGSHLRTLPAGTLHAYAPRTDGLTFQLVPFIVGGVTWVVEAGGVGGQTLTLRPATSSQGFVIATEDTFGVDVCEVSAGVLRIGWCHTAGQVQTDLRMADVTLATGGLTTWSTSTGSLVSTVQPDISFSAFPVGPVEGSDFFTSINLPQHQQVLKQNGLIDPIWLVALQDGANAGVGMIDVNRLQGVVPPELGGTGVTTGLTVLDGQNLIVNSTPLSALVTETESTLLGRGEGLGDGDTEEITLGSGITMTGTVLSASGWSYVPVSTGAEPIVLMSNGAGSVLLVPYNP